MKIILINGQGGTGKTSVAKALMHSINSSAYIEADSLVATNPWEFGDKTDYLAFKNAISLINNFSETGFENIVISGLTRNQELLDSFLGLIDKEIKILFIWLRASKEARKSRTLGRNRDDADKEEYFEFGEKIYPDIETIEVKNGTSLFIDTSKKSVEEIVEEIKLSLSNL